MELTEYISISISNIEKKIDRAKNKSLGDIFDMNILRINNVSLFDVDLNNKNLIDYLKTYQTDRNTKIQCSDIENDMEYKVESEQHDYYHRSTWITDIVDNFSYCYYEIKDKEDIDLLMVLSESIKIAERKNDKNDKKMLYDFLGLVRNKKIVNRKIKSKKGNRYEH